MIGRKTGAVGLRFFEGEQENAWMMEDRKAEMGEYIIADTHAHYDDEAFDEDRELLLKEELPKAGVRLLVNMGASLKGAKESAALSEKYPYVYAACGIHPDDIGDFGIEGEEKNEESEKLKEKQKEKDQEKDQDLDPKKEIGEVNRQEPDLRGFVPSGTAAHRDDTMQILRDLCSREKTLAVGEIGLDYHWMVHPKEEQKHWFAAQISLANELGLPINVHSRDAAQDTFDLIRDNPAKEGGIIHCYSGSLEMAREYVRLGYHIGIGGVVTFKNAKSLKKTVAELPLEFLLTETDSPYLSPEPFRGKRNDSRKIRYVIEAIAAIREIPLEEAMNALYRNARRVYRLPPDEMA